MNYFTFRRLGLLLVLSMLGGCQAANGVYEVRSFGARGDGKHLDTPAVNKAIDAASRAGGATVHFSSGTYLCYSIHLKSNVCLYLDHGAWIQAAGTTEKGQYDPPEPFPFPNQYQDFGHTHWHNSLMWGEDIHDVSILGPGVISGLNALNRGSARPETVAVDGVDASGKKVKKKVPKPAPWETTTEPSPDAEVPWEVEVAKGDIRPGPVTQPSETGKPRKWRWATSRLSPDIPTQDYSAIIATTQPIIEPATKPTTKPEYPDEKEELGPGIGNKAIAIKRGHNVIIRDVSIYEAGHFGILATAVDGLTIDNVKIDTNRDGMDIDCCHNVHVSNCSVNSPQDDGICLKASFGLGYFRDTENVTIDSCMVSGGYMEGSLLDGTFRKIGHGYNNNKHTSRTGRIKFGTESNGGFKNIAISNCLFDNCQGLAIETVDGGVIDNVVVTNIVMRDLVSSPLFIRLGARMRGPKGTPVGAIRHVMISNIIAQCAAQRYACIITGIPGHEIEDLHIHDVRLIFPGGGTSKWAEREPWEQVIGYPDPSRLGGEPSYGFYIRHVSGLEMKDIELSTIQSDARAPFWVRDVEHFYMQHITATHPAMTPMLILQRVEDFTTHWVQGIEDLHVDNVQREKF